MSLYSELETLNPVQREAVTAGFGSLLVLAGAGSGKTRVLVHRVAWLIVEHQIPPSAILAVTFTNKAANEMKLRLKQMLPASHELERMWVGTFHGLAHKLLRRHWQQAGLAQNFQIIDSDDQLRMIKKIYKQFNLDDDRVEPKEAQKYINKNKDQGIRAAKVQKLKYANEAILQDIYLEYERKCNDIGVVDFAELLLKSYELLLNDADIRAFYTARFAHFLVDEFQDTNSIQYLWLKLLTSSAQSVTTVGDDDQSIYGWRGANIENIYQFEHDFPKTKVIRLEQNYRSTKNILQAANALINNNGSRMGKTLWTDENQGEPIILYAAMSEVDESLFIVRQIQEYIAKGGAPCDIGILYRSNAQSRILEESLMKANIPYQIYGGLRFFERAEIKDAIAYLRLAINIKDDAAFDRIVNNPPRSIGERSQQKVKEYAAENNLSLWEAATAMVANNLIVSKAKSGLAKFIDTIIVISKMVEENNLSEVIKHTIYSSGLVDYFKQQRSDRARSRVENLEELVNATKAFEDEWFDEPQTGVTPLLDFLSYTALDGAKQDSSSSEISSCQLMTIHTAKGLEFPLVFVCGLEEGLFPHYFSADDPRSLEEERRLCYVAITRARQKLFLSYARSRRLFGREEMRRPSRFISELPKELIEREDPQMYVRPASFAGEESQELGHLGLGQRVNHLKFGPGTIVDSDGHGSRARVNVCFDKAGNKWLMLEYAKLEPV